MNIPDYTISPAEKAANDDFARGDVKNYLKPLPGVLW